ncbi:MAG TPA: cadmium resistance transporter [Trebonia sp.]|jgi:cadmium resistance protein CadD (predicted permease)|nr:cadmium resistance transporter [Trebonia sp.]
MGSLPADIVTAVALFAGTNVDDVVVLSLLSASSRAGGRPRRWEIWAGQYSGFAILVGLSVAAGRGLALVPGRWLWLLALFPLGVGIVSLAAAIRSARRGEPPRPPSAGGLLGVAALTIVNGADNLAAFTPFFAASGSAQVAVTLVVFAVCVAVWCLAGGLLTRHARVTATLSRYGHWILPAAFILIALYVLYKTNAPIRP